MSLADPLRVSDRVEKQDKISGKGFGESRVLLLFLQSVFYYEWYIQGSAGPDAIIKEIDHATILEDSKVISYDSEEDFLHANLEPPQKKEYTLQEMFDYYNKLLAIHSVKF